MLGHQTLNMLCDKIICRDAYMEAGGDISHNPDIPARMRLGVSGAAIDRTSSLLS